MFRHYLQWFTICCILYKRKHEECQETVKIGYNDNGEEKCDLCNERENCKQENKNNQLSLFLSARC